MSVSNPSLASIRLGLCSKKEITRAALLSDVLDADIDPFFLGSAARLLAGAKVSLRDSVLAGLGVAKAAAPPGVASAL